MNSPPLVVMRGIRKAFLGVMANDHIDWEVNRGEVHALLGENGAGKSTLMKILYGFYRAKGRKIQLIRVRPWRNFITARRQRKE